MAKIANELGVSDHTVDWWMRKHQIPKRTMSEAIYNSHNPNGDPFNFKVLSSPHDYQLLGMGLGLFWGEGGKTYQHSIRLGNTDPNLILTFINFLKEICGVSPVKM